MTTALSPLTAKQAAPPTGPSAETLAALSRCLDASALSNRAYLTREEAAELLTALGKPTTPENLRQLAKKRLGPAFYRRGKRALYRPQEVARWLDFGDMPPLSPHT